MDATTVTHRHWLWPVKFVLEGTVTSEVDIARNKVQGSMEPRNGSCSSYPSIRQATLCLLHLRRHFTLTVIGATLAADMLQSMLPIKT
jgi:hypothetical protein